MAANHRYVVYRCYRQCEKVYQEFYDPQDDTLALINPTVTTELGGNGTFTFDIPKTHAYFGDISPIVDEFMVRDTYINETIFVGRPISYEETDFKTAKVFCEGSLAYLHDILHRPKEWDGITPREFFNELITAYNTRKREVFKSDFQKINIGSCDISDRSLYRNTEWEEIYNLIEKGCVDSDGGYLIMSYDENGQSTLNWYKTPPGFAWQSASIGSNIVSVDENIDLSNAATAFIPIGPRIKDAEGKLTKDRIMLSSNLSEQVTSGQENNNAFWNKYGYVEKAIEYSDEEITNANDLLEKMKKDSEYSMALPWENTSLECVVADLHYLDNTIPKFRIGQEINTNIFRFRSASEMYLQNQKTYITKIVTKLSSAVPEITVGTLKRQSISDQFKKTQETSDAIDKMLDEFDPFANMENGPLDNIENRLENLEDDYYSGNDGLGTGGGLVDDIYIYMGTVQYDEEGLDEPNPTEEGYVQIAENVGLTTYAPPTVDFPNSNFKIIFKVPVSKESGENDVLEMTLDIDTSEMKRSTEGTLLKKTRKYWGGYACITNFKLVYAKANSNDDVAYVTEMSLSSLYLGRDNMADKSTWSVWHD